MTEPDAHLGVKLITTKRNSPVRIVQIITASAIAFGSATASFAASPSAQFVPATYAVGQSVQTGAQSNQTAEIIQVSGKKHYKKVQRQRHKERRKAERRHQREHSSKRHRDYDHRRHSDNNDTAKILGLLGAAAIIANSN